MAKELDTTKFVTKKELVKHKKEMEKLIKNSIKNFKKWDTKQDKALVRTKRAS